MTCRGWCETRREINFRAVLWNNLLQWDRTSDVATHGLPTATESGAVTGDEGESRKVGFALKEER